MRLTIRKDRLNLFPVQEPESPLLEIRPSEQPTKISARSRSQAMDWSLVLASQQIPAKLMHEDPGEGWYLLVSAHDGQNAIRAIRQYHIENRGWPWHHMERWPRNFVGFGCLAWAAALAAFYLKAPEGSFLRTAGIMNSTAVSAGQWWRIFTAMTLHADTAHLIGNLSVGIILLGLAMGRFGSGIALLAATLAGAAGNLASLALTPKPFYGLGASGMVMGALGLVAAQSLHPKHPVPFQRRLIGLAVGLMLFLLYGIAPGNTDIAAHIGGFLAGLLLGALLLLIPTRWRQRKSLDFTAFLLVLAVFASAWRLAATR